MKGRGGGRCIALASQPWASRCAGRSAARGRGRGSAYDRLLAYRLALVATASGWLMRMVYDDAVARRAIRRMQEIERTMAVCVPSLRDHVARQERAMLWHIDAESDAAAIAGLIREAR